NGATDPAYAACGARDKNRSVSRHGCHSSRSHGRRERSSSTHLSRSREAVDSGAIIAEGPGPEKVDGTEALFTPRPAWASRRTRDSWPAGPGWSAAAR